MRSSMSAWRIHQRTRTFLQTDITRDFRDRQVTPAGESNAARVSKGIPIGWLFAEGKIPPLLRALVSS